LNIISEIIDLSPRGIRSYLKLDKPIYSKTSVYGHFGRQADDQGHFSWEKLDLVEELRARLL
jgi:S-adenosylmethionine synthetase